MKKIVAGVFICLTLLSAPPAAVGRERTDREVHRLLLHSTGVVFASGRTRGQTSRGTCWVVDDELRLVVTNYHVVQGHSSFGVHFPAYRDGRVIRELAYYKEEAAIPGRLLVKNRQIDLAILQLRRLPAEITALPLAQRSPRVGQRVYSLGNSQREKGVIWWFRQETVRRVRYGTSRREGHVVRAHLIQGTPNSKPGDSGGPVVDASGRLVGVHSGKGKFSQSIHVRDLKDFLGRVFDP